VVDVNELWDRCAPVLRESVSDAVWQMYLSQVTPVEISGDNLMLGVPNAVVKGRITERFLGLIHDAITAEAGINYEITLVSVGTETPEPSDEPVVTVETTVPVAGSSTSQSPRAGGSVQLDPRFTFDTFVPAGSNRLALAAAQTVAETPGRSYNPLYIYGASGLGKTHLLHAIGNWVLQNYPNHRVLYVTTETFLNDFVEAMRFKTQLAFKKHYRECDVLLIDDVQFMENKEGLQEELFHTYNTLHGAGKQIVLTSDRPPKSIETLEDRLSSRLMSGLLAEIDPPDLETRLAILRTKAQSLGVVLPDDVGEFIATNVKDNIRELEGALIRVSAFASLSGEPLSLELAQSVLSDIGAEPKLITPDMILEAVATNYGLSVDELVGPRRARPLVTARHVAMYLVRNLTDYSYPSIGKVFGGRDHSTCISAVEKISDQMKERRQLYEQVTTLIHQIKGNG
jgi:chromosomal replication initiator protein